MSTRNEKELYQWTLSDLKVNGFTAGLYTNKIRTLGQRLHSSQNYTFDGKNHPYKSIESSICYGAAQRRHNLLCHIYENVFKLYLWCADDFLTD